MRTEAARVSGNPEPVEGGMRQVPEPVEDGMLQVPDSACRHCGVRVRRTPELWLHVGEADQWWYCRTTTTAGPTVDAIEGIVPWHE